MKRISLFGVLLCLGLVARAAEPRAGGAPLSLSSAIRTAIENSPELRAGGARVDAAKGREKQSRAWPNPELEISSEDLPVNGRGISGANNMAGISQTIPHPGKKKAESEAGRAEIAASGAELSGIRAEVARDVKVAYYKILTSEGAVGAAGELLRVAESAVASAGKRFNAGDLTRQEQLRASILHAQARATMIDARRDVDTARQELARAMGQPGAITAPLSGVPAESTDRRLLGLPKDSWMDRHPAMVLARERHARALANARRIGLETRPDVKVGLAAGRNASTNENLMELRVSIPLPVLDANKGKSLEAEAGIREAEEEMAATRQRLAHDWGEAMGRYTAAAKQASLHREGILPMSDEAMGLVKSGFAEGKLGIIDMLDTQRTAADARMAYQKILLELNSARADLESMADPAP